MSSLRERKDAAMSRSGGSGSTSKASSPRSPAGQDTCFKCRVKQPPGTHLFFIQQSTASSSSAVLCAKCFSCAHCKRELGSGEPCQSKDGKIYCADDFRKLFVPKCTGCGQPPPNGEGLFTLKFPPPKEKKASATATQSLCKGCFRCAHCAKGFKSGEKFMPGPPGDGTEGKIYCAADYADLFAPKCTGCKKPCGAGGAGGKVLEALGRVWHVGCFSCQHELAPTGAGEGTERGGKVCGKALLPSSFHADGDVVLCEAHYIQRKGPKCTQCTTPMAKWVMIGGETLCGACHKKTATCFGYAISCWAH